MFKIGPLFHAVLLSPLVKARERGSGKPVETLPFAHSGSDRVVTGDCGLSMSDERELSGAGQRRRRWLAEFLAVYFKRKWVFYHCLFQMKPET